MTAVKFVLLLLLVALLMSALMEAKTSTKKSAKTSKVVPRKKPTPQKSLSTKRSSTTKSSKQIASKKVSSTTQKKKKNILVIDGGGMRGVIVNRILMELEKYLGKGKPLHQMFDLIVGTSTGSIVATGIGFSKMNAKQGLDTYIANGKQIFGAKSTKLIPVPKYSSVPLETVLKKQFGSKTFADFKQSQPKVVAVATNLNTNRPYLFKNYDTTCAAQNDDHEFFCDEYSSKAPIWTAIRSSTAAPTYFASVPIDKGNELIDGGVLFNNPLFLALNESKMLW